MELSRVGHAEAISENHKRISIDDIRRFWKSVSHLVMESTVKIQDSRAVILFAIVTILACQKEPATAEDCILQSVKPSMSKEAAGMVAHACELKFKPISSPLDAFELAMITGRGRHDIGRFFDVTIYNSLNDITVTEIDINLTTTINGEKTVKTYRSFVTITPRRTESFTFQIIQGDRGAGYSWSISGGKGFRTPR